MPEKSLLLGYFLLSICCTAEAGESAEDRFRYDDSRQVYGQALMTPQERLDYRQQLWNLRTEAERERFRAAHREKMDFRARDAGMPLPAEEGFRNPGEKVKPADREERREDGLRRWSRGEGERPEGLRRWTAGAGEKETEGRYGNRSSGRSR